jgi:hypothetical protein
MPERPHRTVRKKPAKRPKPTPLWQYLKLFIYYVIVIVMNLATSFRWEYMWPLFLLVQGIHDSYKFTGFYFSVLYVLVAFIVDAALFIWLPIKLLFVLATCGVFLQKFYDEQARINNIITEQRTTPTNRYGGAMIADNNFTCNTPSNTNHGNDDHNDLDVLSNNFNEIDGNVTSTLSPDFSATQDNSSNNNNNKSNSIDNNNNKSNQSNNNNNNKCMKTIINFLKLKKCLENQLTAIL